MKTKKLIFFLTLITLLLSPSATLAKKFDEPPQVNISWGGLSDKIFQEVAHIDCMATTDTPSFYSQPKEVEVNRVQWNPEKKLLAIWCTNTPSIYIFNADNYELRYILADPTPQLDEGTAEIAWSPDGRYLIKATHWDLDVWNITDDGVKYIKSINRIANHLSISWNPTSKYFADVEGEDTSRKVSIYDVPQLEIINTFGSSPQIRVILWSLDGKTLLAATHDNEIQLWDANTFKLLKRVSQYNERLMTWRSKNEAIGVYCRSTARECTLWLLDTTSFDVKEPFEKTLPLTFSVFQVSSDGSLLAADGGNGQVSVFNVATGNIYTEFKAHSTSVTTMSWHPNKDLLATGGGDGIVRIWQYTEKSN
jgi:WD40 repeat protein